MQKRSFTDLTKRLYQLTTNDLTQFLLALAKGDLETAAKVGGGISRIQLAELQPGGETGKLLDGLERKALSSLVREARVAIAGALPVAASVIRGLIQAPSSLHEAMGGLSPDDAIVQGAASQWGEGDDTNKKDDPVLAAAQLCIPHEKIMARKLEASQAIFVIAKEWRVNDISDAYNEADEEAEDEAALARMAAEQGLGDLPGLGKPERSLRSVPLAS